jgi:DNA-binding NarL/FixJ family response regulator
MTLNARRLFVVWKHPIFHGSVRKLLAHPDVEWVGATSDWVTAHSEIEKLKPDTIVVEELEEKASNEALQILESSSWDVRVVSISLNNNRLSVFHREQKTVGKADDLLHLVLGELP